MTTKAHLRRAACRTRCSWKRCVLPQGSCIAGVWPVPAKLGSGEAGRDFQGMPAPGIKRLCKNHHAHLNEKLVTVGKMDLRLKIDLGAKATSHLLLFFKRCGSSGESASILPGFSREAGRAAGALHKASGSKGSRSKVSQRRVTLGIRSVTIRVQLPCARPDSRPSREGWFPSFPLAAIRPGCITRALCKPLPSGVTPVLRCINN